MPGFIFLGTGPVGGIAGLGKNRRRESSAVLEVEGRRILIDVTSDFNEQKRWMGGVPDVVLVTHGHRDAISGMARLRRWLMQRKSVGEVPVYAHQQTIKRIHRRFKMLDIFTFHALKPLKKMFLFKGVSFLPLLVSHAFNEKTFPTFGYKFFLPNKKTIVYISDTSGWDKGVQREIEGAHMLILDGAMWGRSFFPHLNMKEVTPRAKGWNVKRLLFTQIGKSAPPHAKLAKELKKLWERAEPAYDGMKMTI